LDDRLAAEIGRKMQITAYRVVLEALSNVRKHAHAQTATVTVEDMDGGVHCSVTDDGTGIAPEELGVSLPGHMGMISMRQRVEIARGWIKLHSAPGEGTTIEFWLPGE
jgi:signal transduction histidine kinase